MIFEAWLLICKLGQDPRECVPQTARVHERVGEFENELACARGALLASGGHVAKPGDGEYPKIMCIPGS